jgi:hypothetical protein
MAKLSAAKRNALATGSFALPGRRYPINDPNHARAALSRASANASPAEQATIRAKVHAKYPSIGKDHQFAHARPRTA